MPAHVTEVITFCLHIIYVDLPGLYLFIALLIGYHLFIHVFHIIRYLFWLYVIIIIYNLTTLCVHDILPFMTYYLSCSCSCFSSFSYFISYSCFMNTSIHVFLFLYESTLLRNWNHSNCIIQTRVMTFLCQTSQFT